MTPSDYFRRVLESLFICSCIGVPSISSDCTFSTIKTETTAFQRNETIQNWKIIIICLQVPASNFAELATRAAGQRRGETPCIKPGIWVQQHFRPISVGSTLTRSHDDDSMVVKAEASTTWCQTQSPADRPVCWHRRIPRDLCKGLGLVPQGNMDWFPGKGPSSSSSYYCTLERTNHWAGPCSDVLAIRGWLCIALLSACTQSSLNDINRATCPQLPDEKNHFLVLSPHLE